MRTRRLCLECGEDWTELGDPLCIGCQVEHEMRSAVFAPYAFNATEVDWWGATSADVNDDDLTDGFYVTRLDGEPDEPYVGA